MNVDEHVTDSVRQSAREFGALLETEMRAAGFSRRQLADQIRASKAVVDKAINGGRPPTWDVARRILTACGVDEETIEVRFRPAWEHARNPHSTPTDPEPEPEPEELPVPEPPAVPLAVHQPRSQVPRLLGAAVIAVAVLGIAVGAAYLPVERHRTDPTGSRSVPPSPSRRLRIANDTVPAGMTFADIGARVRTLTDPDATGRYHYVHTHVWATGTDGTTLGHDERVWWASDARGRRTTTPDAGSSSTVQFVAPGDNPFAPLANDEAVLATQLATQQRGPTTAVAMIVAVKSLYDTMCPTPTQRAMVIDILAHAEGITDDGHAQDRNGRSGIGISTAVNGSDTYRMIFDVDGYPLEFEHTTAEPEIDPGAPTVTFDEVYLEHARTSQLP
jgi:transcriptional regulator with XRE-family HTH domain